MTAELIAGKYEVLETIGRGGMGTVYKARQKNLDRIVAVKMLSEELAADIEFRARFQQEATVVARLSHPNIVAVYDIEPHNHTFCIIMEYLEGENLQQKIDRNVALSEREVMTIGAQVARALNYAHSQGIVHRDIKPDNIHVTPRGVAKVMDFGIARYMESKLKTQTGISMGTPKFMSPEQVTGKNVDNQSDLYSLGVCLYYCIAGRPPFDGENAIAIATRHLYEQPVPLSQINTSVSPSVEKAVMRALEKSKAARYATGAEMAEALEEALEIHTPIRVTEGREVYAGVTQRIPSATTQAPHSGVEDLPVTDPMSPSTPSGIHRMREAAGEGMLRNAGDTSPSLKPIPILEDFSYTPIVEEPAVGSRIERFLRRWWTGIGALLLIAAGLVYVVAGSNRGGGGKGPHGPEAPSVAEEFSSVQKRAADMVDKHNVIEALQLWQGFQKSHPDFNSDVVDDRIDLLTSQLPTSQREALADRRKILGNNFAGHPDRYWLAKAYLAGASDLYDGLSPKKTNSAKPILAMVDRQLSATLIAPETVERAAKAKEKSEQAKKASVANEEQLLMDAISLDPLKVSYWNDLGDYYKRIGRTDDARVIYGWAAFKVDSADPVERNAARVKLEGL